MRKDSSEKKNYIAAIPAMTALSLLLSLITGAESAYAIVEEASEELTIGGVPVVVQWDNLLLTAIAIFFVVLFTMQRKKAIKASMSDHSLEMGNITFFKQRLEKELAKNRGFLENQRRKLSNESFVSRAPANVVATERERAEKLEALIANLEESLRQLG